MTTRHFVHFETARLLVADDDPILREFAVSHLSSDAVEVVTVPDGNEAFHLLTRSKFDIALIDLDMPVIDGLELIGLVRAHPELKHLPLVIATGREDLESVDRAFAAGATSFVVKPLNWRLISHQISYVLRSSREEVLVRQTLAKLQKTNAVHIDILDQAIARLQRMANQPAAEDVDRLAGDLAEAVRLMR